MTFKAGESGNIKGRPKGIKDRRTAFREMVEPRAQELIEKAVNLALEGNEPMLRLLLERLLPAKPKDEPVMINLCSDDLREQSENVCNAVLSGDVNIKEAMLFLNAIMSKAKILKYGEDQALQAALWGAVRDEFYE